jgi:hypothetical protein
MLSARPQKVESTALLFLTCNQKLFSNKLHLIRTKSLFVMFVNAPIQEMSVENFFSENGVIKTLRH